MSKREYITELIESAPKGSRWMLIICDTFSYEDYPEYFSSSEKCLKRIRQATAGENMMRLMECYDLKMDIEAQIAEHRAMNLPKRT